MMRCIDVHGIKDLKTWLQAFVKDNEKWIPETAAAILASESTRAFVDPSLRIQAWAPLKSATQQSAGRKGSKYRAARQKQNEWAIKERELLDQVRSTTGKKRKSINAKRKAAAVKAAKYKKLSIAERNKSGASRRPLIDTGRLWHSITYQGQVVTTDALYAAVHQWGGKGGMIPARPFIPITLDGKTTDHAAELIARTVATRLSSRLK